MSSPIPNRILEQWAKEVILEFIDEAIKETTTAGSEYDDADDTAALKKQRNRIAKFLKLK